MGEREEGDQDAADKPTALVVPMRVGTGRGVNCRGEMRVPFGPTLFRPLSVGVNGHGPTASVAHTRTSPIVLPSRAKTSTRASRTPSPPWAPLPSLQP